MKTSPVPVARFTCYFSRKGAKDAKDAKGREGNNMNLDNKTIIPRITTFSSSFAFLASLRPLREELGVIVP
jgi:hypothetical protein